MAKSENYTGNVELIDGLIPANGEDFALMDAHYVMTEGGTRLDEKLNGIVEEVLNALPYAEEVSV